MLKNTLPLTFIILSAMLALKAFSNDHPIIKSSHDTKSEATTVCNFKAGAETAPECALAKSCQGLRSGCLEGLGNTSSYQCVQNKGKNPVSGTCYTKCIYKSGVFVDSDPC